MVDDFFGRPWVKAFCGEGAATELGNRLDAREMADLRQELARIYATTFALADPGFAGFGLNKVRRVELLADIPQIEPPFLDIAPAGMLPTIISHSKGVKCVLIRSNSSFHGPTTGPAKRKISKPLVYDQVSSLGSPFALYDPVTVINPDAPKVD